MNVREKVVNAIEDADQAYREYNELKQKLEQADRVLVAAHHEAARQIKNYKGPGATVLYKGQLYTCVVENAETNQLDLAIDKADFEILG